MHLFKPLAQRIPISGVQCCEGDQWWLACRDLHQNIGRGEIGPGCFERLMADPRLDGLPLIMETPAQSEGPPIDFVQSLQLVRFGLTSAA